MKDPKEVLEKALERNQPVFVIVGQDRLAMAAINAYVVAANISRIDSDQYQELLKIHKDFDKWQIENEDAIKWPD